MAPLTSSQRLQNAHTADTHVLAQFDDSTRPPTPTPTLSECRINNAPTYDAFQDSRRTVPITNVPSMAYTPGWYSLMNTPSAIITLGEGTNGLNGNPSMPTARSAASSNIPTFSPNDMSSQDMAFDQWWSLLEANNLQTPNIPLQPHLSTRSNANVTTEPAMQATKTSNLPSNQYTPRTYIDMYLANMHLSKLAAPPGNNPRGTVSSVPSVQIQQQVHRGAPREAQFLQNFQSEMSANAAQQPRLQEQLATHHTQQQQHVRAQQYAQQQSCFHQQQALALHLRQRQRQSIAQQEFRAAQAQQNFNAAQARRQTQLNVKRLFQKQQLPQLPLHSQATQYGWSPMYASSPPQRPTQTQARPQMQMDMQTQPTAMVAGVPALAVRDFVPNDRKRAIPFTYESTSKRVRLDKPHSLQALANSEWSNPPQNTVAAIHRSGLPATQHVQGNQPFWHHPQTIRLSTSVSRAQHQRPRHPEPIAGTVPKRSESAEHLEYQQSTTWCDPSAAGRKLDISFSEACDKLYNELQASSIPLGGNQVRPAALSTKASPQLKARVPAHDCVQLSKSPERQTGDRISSPSSKSSGTQSRLSDDAFVAMLRTAIDTPEEADVKAENKAKSEVSTTPRKDLASKKKRTEELKQETDIMVGEDKYVPACTLVKSAVGYEPTPGESRW